MNNHTLRIFQLQRRQRLFSQRPDYQSLQPRKVFSDLPEIQNERCFERRQKSSNTLKIAKSRMVLHMRTSRLHRLDLAFQRRSPIGCSYVWAAYFGEAKNDLENILKTMLSLASIRQALEHPSQQTTIFPSVSDNHGKLQSRPKFDSGLPRCRESLRQCLPQWTQVQNLPD